MYDATVYIVDFFFSPSFLLVSLTADDLHHKTILLHFFSILNPKLLYIYIYRSKTNIEYAEKQEDHISIVHSRALFALSVYLSFFYRMRELEISACDSGNDAVFSYIDSTEIEGKMRNLVLSESNSIEEN